MQQLVAQPRVERGKKAKQVRKTGHIPAVLYGYGVTPTAVQVEARAFEKTWREAGESSLVSLRVEGEGTQTVLIHDVQRDVLRGNPIHADFYAVRMDHPIEANIPLEFTGEADAIKALGGILVKVAHELEIRALPKDLPHVIQVDITPLHTLGDQIFVKDIAVPDGVEVLADGEQVVVLVEAPRTAEELAAIEQPAEVSLESIEIAGKKPKEESDEGENAENSKDADKKE
ncbi:MAG: 50S ribosomal protein L25 [Patescibacteria group bacterium]